MALLRLCALADDAVPKVQREEGTQLHLLCQGLPDAAGRSTFLRHQHATAAAKRIQ